MFVLKRRDSCYNSIKIMRIFAEQEFEKTRLELMSDSERRIKSMLALSLARFLEDKLPIEKTLDNNFTEKHRTEIYVLSVKDIEELGEIISSFESYAKDYPAMYAVQDKLRRIQEIFLKENFE